MYIKMLFNIKYKYRNMLFNIKYKFRNTSPFDMCMYMYINMYIKYHIPLLKKETHQNPSVFMENSRRISKALALQLLARQATGPRKARGVIESICVDDGKSMLVATFTEILKKKCEGPETKKMFLF